MIIIMLGAPGCGKGTQAKLLAEKLKIPHLSMGDMLREAVEKKTKVGRIAADYLKEGRLVPDEIINGIAEEQINSSKFKNGFILDGYPRTLFQASAFDEMLTKAGLEIDKVIYIYISLVEAIKRISGRRSCTNCKKVYHLEYNPPKSKLECICDDCGCQLQQRDDDREETVRKRFEIYEKNTLPLNGYYLKKGKLIEVAGKGEISRIFSEILDKLGLN